MIKVLATSDDDDHVAFYPYGAIDLIQNTAYSLIAAHACVFQTSSMYNNYRTGATDVDYATIYSILHTHTALVPSAHRFTTGHPRTSVTGNFFEYTKFEPIVCNYYTMYFVYGPSVLCANGLLAPHHDVTTLNTRRVRVRPRSVLTRLQHC